jgi:hypothetical protein
MTIGHVLNDEKLTIHFMSFSKIRGQEGAISDICDPEGRAFDTTESRSEYIKNYFQEIYKNPMTANLEQNCIENFLGETAHHNTVTSAKLTNDERLDLDRPISIQELDQSLNNSNLKSAPGPDGINNIFIKHFWDLFRNPLLKYANACFEMGFYQTILGGLGLDLFQRKATSPNLKIGVRFLF